MSYNNIVGSGYGRRKPLQSANFPTSPQPKSVLRPKQWDDKVEEGIILKIDLILSNINHLDLFGPQC